VKSAALFARFKISDINHLKYFRKIFNRAFAQPRKFLRKGQDFNESRKIQSLERGENLHRYFPTANTFYVPTIKRLSCKCQREAFAPAKSKPPIHAGLEAIQ
jgi:hypothetical protein